MPTLPNNTKEPTDGKPWEGLGRPFTDEEELENRLYCCVLDGISIEQAQIAPVDLRRLEPAYDRLAEKRKAELRLGSQHQLWHQGIDSTRSRMGPAYTFDKFLELPLEIRLKIWSYGARHEDPRTYELGYPRAMNVVSGFVSIGRSYCLPRSPPAILHVCGESRVEAQRTFSLLPYTVGSSMVQKYGYFNVLYDNFHITSDGPLWFESAILLFLFLRFGTIRPLLPEMLHCIDSAQKLQNITVDFGIFTEVPVKYWFEFTCLETLGISIHQECEYVEDSQRRVQLESRPVSKPIRFVIPAAATHNGKRAEFIMGRATQAFLEFSIQTPKFRCPKIEVVVQKRREGRKVGDGNTEGGEVVYGPELTAPFASNISARCLTELKNIRDVAWLDKYVGGPCQLEEWHHKDVACDCLGTFAPELDHSTMGYHSLDF